MNKVHCLFIAGLFSILCSCNGSNNRTVDGGKDGGSTWPTCEGSILEDPCLQEQVKMGPACVPRVPSCNAREVPVPGGSCTATGVGSCSEGFTKKSDGTCDAVIADLPCPEGTIPILGQTNCMAVGPTASCGVGTYEG